MNLVRVVLGSIFTILGIFSILIPSFPYICIGALIFGPIMLISGLIARDPSEQQASVQQYPAQYYQQPYSPAMQQPAYNPPPQYPAAGPAQYPQPQYQVHGCPSCGTPLTYGPDPGIQRMYCPRCQRYI